MTLAIPHGMISVAGGILIAASILGVGWVGVAMLLYAHADDDKGFAWLVIGFAVAVGLTVVFYK